MISTAHGSESGRRSILGSRYDRAARPYISLDAGQRSALQLLRDAIQRNEIELEVTSCPLCSSDDAERIASIDRHLLPIVHDLCRSCGLLYSSRRLSPKSAELFYNDYYVPLHGGVNRPEADYFANQRNHGRYVFDFVRSAFHQQMRVVEFGCGPGGILSLFAEEGAIVSGYELNAGFSANRPASWPRVLPGTIETALERGEKYDLVILSHLLNLLFDPLDTLRKVRSLVADGGFVYIEVPGLRSYDKGHYSLCGHAASHPYKRDLMRGIALPQNIYFEASVMQYLLEQAGFAVVSVTELVRVLAKAVEVPSAGAERAPREALEGNYERNREYLLHIERLRRRYAPLNITVELAKGPLRLVRRAISRLVRTA
jgi:SAM-dependent methyltransferase